MSESESFIYGELRQTKNKVVFEAEDPTKCPIKTFYIEKWHPFAEGKILQLTIQPVVKK